MSLLRIARVPAVSVPPASSVQTAIDTMVASKSGAVVVVAHQDIPVGIFTARDLVRRVMAAHFPHDVIRISEVMTSDPKVVTSETGPREALSIMVQNHIRHLPIVDADHRLQGMLSTRHLLREMLVDLSQELDSLQAYIAADSIGG
jgi:CBS domain-containing protein